MDFEKKTASFVVSSSRKGELLSTCHGSARGLARVAAAMAGQGELEGCRIMKPATWTNMHAGPKTGLGAGWLNSTITRGGAWICEDNPHDGYMSVN